MYLSSHSSSMFLFDVTKNPRFSQGFCETQVLAFWWFTICVEFVRLSCFFYSLIANFISFLMVYWILSLLFRSFAEMYAEEPPPRKSRMDIFYYFEYILKLFEYKLLFLPFNRKFYQLFDGILDFVFTIQKLCGNVRGRAPPSKKPDGHILLFWIYSKTFWIYCLMVQHCA